MNMLSVEEAQERLLAMAEPLVAETVDLADANDRYLAGAVSALRSQPASDLSAMDGYAVRFDDLPGPLALIGESAAGAPYDAVVQKGETVRIFTGAVMPEGADTVLLQEDAETSGKTVSLAGDGPGSKGRHVRKAGGDFPAGETLLHPGELLGPAQLALLTMAGHGKVAVGSLPRIAIIATGDELVPPGKPVGVGQIPSSNNLMLGAMLATLPATVIDAGILPDRLDVMIETFESLDADIIVTTGGVSVGDHDLVRPALEQSGGELDFWRVAMKPGKPLMAGRLKRSLLLGLPGNPGSAFVTAHLFLLPLVRRLAGAAECGPKTEQRPLAVPLPAGGRRTEFLRAKMTEGKVAPLSRQDSGMVSTLAAANGLIVQPAATPSRNIGDTVDFLPLR